MQELRCRESNIHATLIEATSHFVPNVAAFMLLGLLERDGELG